MPVRLSRDNVEAIRLGQSEVEAAYHGQEKIFPEDDGAVAFTFSDWTGSVNNLAQAGGTPTLNIGNAAEVSTTNSFGANTECSVLNRTVNVSVVVPESESYNNSGDTVTGDVVITQAALPEFANPGNPTVEISQDGVVSAESGYVVTPASFQANTDCDPVNRTISWTYTIPAGYCNTGDADYSGGPVTVSQAGLSTFGSGDWNGSFAVSSGGVPSVSDAGNLNSVTVTSSNFLVSCSDIDRTVNGTGVVPSGYCNAGDTITISGTANQPAQPEFEYSDAEVSGFAVSDEGVITAPTAGLGTIMDITYQGSVNNTSYAQVTEDTTRTAQVRVTVPSGWCNVGEFVSGNETATQEAPPPVVNFISLSEISMTFDDQAVPEVGNVSTVTISPSSATFTVTDSATWIHTSVSGNDITVTVDSLSGDNVLSRKGKVTVTHGDDSDVTATIDITQTGSE